MEVELCNNEYGSANSVAVTKVSCGNMSKEINLASVLVFISILFIICQSVKIIPDLYEVFFCERNDEGRCVAGAGIEYTVEVSHVLLAVNSSANFLIYAARGEYSGRQF